MSSCLPLAYGRSNGPSTVCLCLGSTGPLYASYMLSGGYSWRLFFYVEFAFGAALLILAFFFVEETQYKRVPPASSSPPSSPPESENEKDGAAAEHREATIARNANDVIPSRKTFIQTLKVWSGINHEVPFFMTSIRALSYYLVPCVFWVVTSYGERKPQDSFQIVNTRQVSILDWEPLRLTILFH